MANRVLQLQQSEGKAGRLSDGPLSNSQVLALFRNPVPVPGASYLPQRKAQYVQTSPQTCIVRSEPPRSIPLDPDPQQTRRQDSPQQGRPSERRPLRSPISLWFGSPPESSPSSPNSAQVRSDSPQEFERDPRLSFKAATEATRRLVTGLELDLEPDSGLEAEPSKTPQKHPPTRVWKVASLRTEPLSYTSYDPESPEISATSRQRKMSGSNSPHMPYNNATIPPPEEITGSASLPLARVKKILNVDEDTNTVSNQAAFAITIATELFIRYLSDQAMNVVKSEKKPRRNIQYKDIADAVARVDNLQFLEDVIPRTTTYKQYRANKAKKATKAAQGAESLQNGQTTLDGSRSLPQRPVGTAEALEDAMDNGNISDGTIDEPSAADTRLGPSRSNGTGALVFEHYEPNGTSKRDGSGDVEMD